MNVKNSQASEIYMESHKQIFSYPSSISWKEKSLWILTRFDSHFQNYYRMKYIIRKIVVLILQIWNKMLNFP